MLSNELPETDLDICDGLLLQQQGIGLSLSVAGVGVIILKGLVGHFQVQLPARLQQGMVVKCS